jgi:hypothetical protein
MYDCKSTIISETQVLLKVLRYFQEKQHRRLRLQNMKRYQNLFNGNEFLNIILVMV